MILAVLANVFFIASPTFATSIAPTTTTPAPTFATLGDCGKSFLTFKPWFNGLCDDANNTIAPPDTFTTSTTNGLTVFVWVIVLNVIAILLQLIGYLSVGFIIWGGYSFILAQGEPSKLSTAQKTIINAIIGLIIAIFANVIINTVIHFLTKDALPGGKI
jgi:FtsH-binding integral membrane protein